MLNLFQHLMESISYETLKRVQGDKNELRHSLPLKGGGLGWGGYHFSYGVRIRWGLHESVQEVGGA
jgi:hypothetical protein